MRCFAFLSILICIVTSCNNTDSSKKQVIKKEIIPEILGVGLLDVDVISFAGLYEKKQLDGLKSIPQAQSKAEWILAAKNKIGAWCYVDTSNKLGVLYNGYCLNNKAFQDILLPDSIYQGFENNMQAKPDQISDYDSLLMIERNANGNFYNLGYHSFWVGPEANSGNHKIISLDQSNGDIKLRSVNTGNGYFMRFLK
jgi:hypothetical protein